EKSSNHATFFRGHNTDLEWLAQIRYVLDDQNKFYTQGGFGTRLTNGYGSPDFRMLISIGTYWTLVDFEPKAPPKKIHIVPDVNDYDRDSDGDGYSDAVDKCSTVKEDHKPPAPSDGCPADSDRDGDGVPDAKDQCP